MKFLFKNAQSKILARNLTYRKGASANNKIIKDLLVQEQKNFCAYTEKYIEELDATEIEHFDPSLKYRDSYYNYYAVLRKANQYKKDRKYKDATFFENRFFQDPEQFNQRIKYFKGGLYEEVDEEDQEASELIDYLGFNHPQLYEQRKRHIRRLIQTLKDANYSKSQCISYFKKYKENLSFISAIEIEMDIDLSECI